jgi:hypothetical protein
MFKTLRIPLASAIVLSLAGLHALAYADFQTEKNQILGNLPGMCVSSTESFMPQAFNASLEDYQRLLQGSHSSISEEALTFDVWQASMVPLEWVRVAAYKRMRIMAAWKLDGYQDVYNALKNKTALPVADWEAPDPKNPHRKFRSVEEMRHIAREDKASIQQGMSPMAQKVLCSEITLMNAGTCGRGIAEIVDWMHATAYFSMPELIAEVATNPIYEEGLRQAALLIMNRVSSGPADGHLDEDLQASFRNAGVAPAKAQELTMNVLGVIATAGPNIIWRMALLNLPGESQISKVAISAIAIAAPILDLRTLKSAHSYSFPRQLQSFCDPGKSYHFWMSAYLAWRLGKETGNQEAARAAAFIVAKGYQMRATTGSGGSKDPKAFGRNPLRAFTEQPLSEINNRIRIDLSFAAAGSSYGAALGTGKNPSAMNVDRAMHAVFSASQDLPVLTPEEAQAQWDGTGVSGYHRWQQVFAPDTALDSFE